MGRHDVQLVQSGWCSQVVGALLAGVCVSWCILHKPVLKDLNMGASSWF